MRAFGIEIHGGDHQVSYMVPFKVVSEFIDVAKRLSILLGNVLKEYESRFGPLA